MRRTRHAVCLEYLRSFSVVTIVPSATLLSINIFVPLHAGTREHSWRTEFPRPYVRREALCASLYTFIRAAQSTCIAQYRDPRLYTTEDHWGILVPLPREFVDDIQE